MFPHLFGYPPAPMPTVRPLRPGPVPRTEICVVGTAADRPFAAALARAGARVTLLDGSLEGLPGPAAAGVAEIEACAGAAPTHRHGPLRALLVHERLARWRFDHVLVCGAAGVGHYACIARDLGLAHAGTGVWLVDVRLRVAELERGLSFPDGRTDIEPWVIDYATYLDPDLNGFYAPDDEG